MRTVLPAIALYVALVMPVGCEALLPPGADPSLESQPAATLVGRDSAGASIELRIDAGDVATARVRDVVLRTGEADVSSDDNGNLTFTVTFPLGVMITYTGTLEITDDATALVLDGAWTQHAAGIFGTDTGSWTVASQPG
jgi:hypothetical protein